MFKFPYGSMHQLNLDWIINEIIDLHHQVDPSWTGPDFNSFYPYTNMNELNLDWILAELKTIRDLAPEETDEILLTVSNAFITSIYSSTQPYNVNDIIFKPEDNTLYICNTSIPSGEFWDPSHWTRLK